MVIYYFPLFILFCLAISDLIVGVSNDAVNFTNSAVGSRVASRKVIFFIASLGILVGVSFSGGMLEIARKGIFYPQFFTFDHVITIFLAVMFTDVVLLDLFNTYGLPTSTTVSLVFELLGSSVAISILLLLNQGADFSRLGEYINSDRALLMIFSIFISVLIAFTFGLLVQFISRLIFTFDVDRHLKNGSSVWSAFAVTIIFYFIFIKGLKGSVLIAAEQVSWLLGNTLWILAGIFIICLILFTILTLVSKINPLKIVVLTGTFALALSFAANDLVNFIGVPIAGYTSYLIAAQAGNPDGLLMEALNTTTDIPVVLVLTASIVMIVTLWISKKARNVTKTEVDLARQDSKGERFNSSRIANGLVDISYMVFGFFNHLVPAGIRNRIRNRLKRNSKSTGTEQTSHAAFDLVRASVNLTVASSLIAFGTSLKLPLSTTYVTFMVAMGSSLADGAWNMNVAPLRVNGVLIVIGGWFVTAFVAFCVAFIFALLIYWGNLTTILLLSLLSIFFVLRTHKVFKERPSDYDSI